MTNHQLLQYKNVSIKCGIYFILFCFSACQGGNYNKTFELKPNATESITIQSKQEVKVGWDLVENEAGWKCPEQKCIKLERKDDFGYIGGQFGAAMNFTPKEGKMSFILENLAPFKIKVRVYTESAIKH